MNKQSVVNETYLKLIDELKFIMKNNGFHKNNVTFYRKEENNYGFVNFQKSVNKCATDKIVFTINLGVFSLALWQFFSSNQELKKPSILDCQWRQRIGQLLEVKQDMWWEINENTNLEYLVGEIFKVLAGRGLPLLIRITPDRGLMEHLKQDTDLWATTGNRLKYLAYLYKMYNLNSEFEEIVSEIRRMDFKKPEDREQAERTIKRIAVCKKNL